jgi:POT family proton-dependent oligopeptide transporter
MTAATDYAAPAIDSAAPETAAPGALHGARQTPRILGHPPGLVILFFAEMWERFSYYGMRGLLKLYMVNYLFVALREPLQGCKHAATPCTLVAGDPHSTWLWPIIQPLLPAAPGEAASLLYGTYTALVYLTPFFGGIVADRWLGQRKTVVVGGTLMALGHFVMAYEPGFFLALGLLIVGNGAFKPNVSTQVGGLYPPGDPRKDGAYTIFYMGINLGAFICNFVCGTLAAVYGWHYGFAAAGVGMVLGLIVYLWGQRFLASDNLAVEQSRHVEHVPLTKSEWRRVWALVMLCGLNIIFWAVYEQQGNTMQSWADENTVWPVVHYWFGDHYFQIPSTWFQSFNPFFIIALAPLLDIFWRWQAKRGTEPSSVSKMAIGCIVLGLSFIVMIIGARVVGTGRGSIFWPFFCTFLLTFGELYLSPIGLALVAKVSPTRIVSMMMGMWFISSFAGNFLSGAIGVYYERWSKDTFFGVLLVLGVGAGLAIAAFNRPLRNAMADEPKAAPAT